MKDFLLKRGGLLLEEQAAWTCGKNHGSPWWWLKIFLGKTKKGSRGARGRGRGGWLQRDFRRSLEKKPEREDNWMEEHLS